MNFSRESRLTTQADFRFVFARSRTSQDRWFRVLRRANGRAHSRLGMAVSLKVSKRAVDRNRLKRLIRESFRHSRAELDSAGGVDVVVLPQAGAASISNADLNRSLVKHWRRCARPADQETQQGNQN